jgi:hypothetical protein
MSTVIWKFSDSTASWRAKEPLSLFLIRKMMSGPKTVKAPRMCARIASVLSSSEVGATGWAGSAGLAGGASSGVGGYSAEGSVG